MPAPNRVRCRTNARRKLHYNHPLFDLRRKLCFEFGQDSACVEQDKLIIIRGVISIPSRRPPKQWQKQKLRPEKPNNHL